MAVVKAKIFTFNAGWGYIASKPDRIEEAINEFIEKNGLSDKEILNMTQSESQGKLFTLTFLYKD